MNDYSMKHCRPSAPRYFISMSLERFGLSKDTNASRAVHTCYNADVSTSISCWAAQDWRL